MNPKINNHFLSLIIPVYKQEKTIAKNLRKIKIVLDQIRYDYEMIVVIDGTVDRSFEKIKKEKIPKIKCLVYKENHGKSFAVRLGMSYAKGDYIMFIDSGMEIDPNGISMLIEHMEWYNADIIVGSKRHLASQVGYTFQRKILSQVYYFIVKLMFGLKIHDTQAGIKIFKKEVIKKVLPRLLEKKFTGDLEMLVVADSQRFKRIYEAPIKLNYKFSSLTSAATLSSIYGIFLNTLAIFYRRYFLDYYRRPHKQIIIPKDLKIINT